ncbi:hypothetical protein CR513_54015, partial [Mucuna pruriens]
MRVNPDKGIEANPDKCETIINMKSPQNMKEQWKKHDLFSNSLKNQHIFNGMKNVRRHSKTSKNF